MEAREATRPETATEAEDPTWYVQRDAIDHILNNFFRARELSDGQTKVSILNTERGERGRSKTESDEER